jgi:hypothetical protein
VLNKKGCPPGTAVINLLNCMTGKNCRHLQFFTSGFTHAVQLTAQPLPGNTYTAAVSTLVQGIQYANELPGFASLPAPAYTAACC